MRNEVKKFKLAKLMNIFKILVSELKVFYKGVSHYIKNNFIFSKTVSNKVLEHSWSHGPFIQVTEI